MNPSMNAAPPWLVEFLVPFVDPFIALSNMILVAIAVAISPK
jgi:hypothetical protein